MVTGTTMNFMILLTMAATTVTTNTYTEEWQDAKRDRTVPVRIFLPETDKPCPVALLSHGLGGSREGFGYLGELWSTSGYVVIVMQHPGSDISIHRNRKRGENPREIMKKAASPENAQLRYDDVKFVLDELERRNKSKEKSERLTGRLDLDRIGIGGHSFGSQTTLAAVGRFPYKAEPRLKAAIAFSPNRTKIGDQKRIHAPIQTPMFHFTGTRDDSPLEGNFDPLNRRIPYDSITGPEQYLVIFKGGDHMLFSGHPRPLGRSEMEKRCQPLIAEMTLKFLDAYLKDDAEAKTWLQGKGLAEMMKDLGTVEMKGKKE